MIGAEKHSYVWTCEEKLDIYVLFLPPPTLGEPFLSFSSKLALSIKQSACLLYLYADNNGESRNHRVSVTHSRPLRIHYPTTSLSSADRVVYSGEQGSRTYTCTSTHECIERNFRSERFLVPDTLLCNKPPVSILQIWCTIT